MYIQLFVYVKLYPILMKQIESAGFFVSSLVTRKSPNLGARSQNNVGCCATFY